jgi:hypothetical protein
MLEFPDIEKTSDPKLPKMSLEEYIDFCESCLKSNPSITPQNCMSKRTDEATMPPFHILPRKEKK